MDTLGLLQSTDVSASWVQQELVTAYTATAIQHTAQYTAQHSTDMDTDTAHRHRTRRDSTHRDSKRVQTQRPKELGRSTHSTVHSQHRHNTDTAHTNTAQKWTPTQHTVDTTQTDSTHREFTPKGYSPTQRDQTSSDVAHTDSTDTIQTHYTEQCRHTQHIRQTADMNTYTAHRRRTQHTAHGRLHSTDAASTPSQGTIKGDAPQTRHTLLYNPCCG